MRLESFPTTATMEDPEAQVNFIQRRAARSAETVGEFGSRFKTDLHQMLLDEAKGGDGTLDSNLEAVAHEREQLIERATDDNRNMMLKNLGDRSKLGQAPVGGGSGNGELNEEHFEEMTTQDDVERMHHAGEHEEAHLGQDYVSLLANEGHAEIKANLETGRAMSYHRPDQPTSVYKEGQDMMLEGVERFGGWERLDAMMTGEADKTDLLAWLAEVDPELGGQSTTNPENN